ncbi:MAG: dTDP-4-dehydrorhamnose reductase [Candidatus Saganbacteria bacterium]|uniref:dTDP-4-dehydrorhamnose reductase n=1 Tax=Candidatus Saganbacteria bacterium TaxID=2575572 RepID=A0A833L2D6_UNCSA|nr:MAG: dTDP-4-dehydrorhamnose reductase [Candidatus Saganbacteria bacterium]
MILVTGANGMVGSYVKEIFHDVELALTDIPEMDVTNKDLVFSLVAKYKPTTVLHLAAETNVDKCESEIDHAFRTNAMGTYNVALACQKFNAVMIYISTGGVFNGHAGQIHTEFDSPAPLNIYSKAKYEGELIVRDLLHKYYIFRAGWMIGGGSAKDKKFVGKIIELCKTRDEIEVVNDKFGSPTFARDFLRGINKIIKTGNFGLYHLANTGVCSRYEIALEIVKLLGREVMIIPVSSDRFPLPAQRAASEAIKNYKLDLLGINPMPSWKQALEEYIKEWGT